MEIDDAQTIEAPGPMPGGASSARELAEFYGGIAPTLRELRARKLSLRQIAAELDARGIAARGGGAWSAVQVSRAITYTELGVGNLNLDEAEERLDAWQDDATADPSQVDDVHQADDAPASAPAEQALPERDWRIQFSPQHGVFYLSLRRNSYWHILPADGLGTEAECLFLVRLVGLPLLPNEQARLTPFVPSHAFGLYSRLKHDAERLGLLPVVRRDPVAAAEDQIKKLLVDHGEIFPIVKGGAE